MKSLRERLRKLKAARFFVFLGLLGLLACATVQEGQVREALKSWEGRNYHDLVAAMGVPQQVTDMGKGGKMVVYAQGETIMVPGMTFGSYSVTSPQGTLTPGYGTPGRVETKTAQKIFWVDAGGTIYRTAYYEQ